jgi:hypothetical protein
MTYFHTFKNRLLNLIGSRNPSKSEPLKSPNKIDFISLPDNLSELETAKMFCEVLRKQGWTVTDKKGLLDKLDK